MHRLLLFCPMQESPNFCLWNPESGKIFLGFVIRNTAQRIQNPSSTDKDWNQAPGIRNPRRGIPNSGLSWKFPDRARPPFLHDQLSCENICPFE